MRLTMLPLQRVLLICVIVLIMRSLSAVRGVSFDMAILRVSGHIHISVEITTN
jgi:hypothetical protein